MAEAIDLYDQSNQIFNEVGFILSKWSSNNANLQESFIISYNSNNVLGLAYNNINDTFYFSTIPDILMLPILNYCS